MKGDKFRNILSLSNILILVLLVITISIAFIWFKSSNNDKTEALEQDISDLQSDINFYEETQENYTPEKVNKKIDEDHIDVEKSFNDKESDIEKGVKEVYENIDSMEDYENLDESINEYLGDDFTEKLTDISKPKVSESGEEDLPYDSLEDLKIAFGEYDIVNHTAKSFVLVDYKSSEIGANNPGIERDDKQVKIGGQDLFILNYDLENDSLELEDFKRNDEVEEASDE
ncbi:MAG TPA: hypothetical protein VK108_11755 [Pseudogracilibacillus sp.]|nr:hypothetical protein [Pseudogracilibacillus sp.]